MWRENQTGSDYALAQPHPLTRLAALELPRPHWVEDVENEFDDWLTANVADAGERASVLDPALLSGSSDELSFGRRERALCELLGLLLVPSSRWATPNGYGPLVNRIEEISKMLAPEASVMAHLKAKAAAYVSEECVRLRDDPARLVSLLGRMPLKVHAGDTVVLPFGGTIVLSRFLECAAADGLSLWRLRSLVTEGMQQFDKYVVARRQSLVAGLLAGLRRILRPADERSPDLGEYLAAFPVALPGSEAIPAILTELRGARRVVEGLSAAATTGAWFDALAALRGWTPETLGILVHLEDRSADACDARMRAILAASAEIAEAFPSSAVSACLHVLRVARRRLEEARHLDDADRQARIRERIRVLPRGAQMLALDEHLSDLPLGIPGEDRIWGYLGEGTKGQWRFKVEAAVSKDHAMALGLAEFLFASTTKEAFEDVEPLISDLLSDEEGVAFLDALEFSPDRRTVLRAGEVRRSLLRREPAG